nr:hypothetical protein Iba_chr09dCG3450 [Ipomoea batatas]
MAASTFLVGEEHMFRFSFAGSKNLLILFMSRPNPPQLPQICMILPSSLVNSMFSMDNWFIPFDNLINISSSISLSDDSFLTSSTAFAFSSISFSIATPELHVSLSSLDVSTRASLTVSHVLWNISVSACITRSLDEKLLVEFSDSSSSKLTRFWRSCILCRRLSFSFLWYPSAFYLC